MNKIAWIPKGVSLPVEMIVAVVPVGKVTERIWIQALADRVEKMVKAEPDPVAAMKWATRVLDRPPETDPNQAGDVLVLHNLEFRTRFSLAVIDKQPFPANASKADLAANEAVSKTDLTMWLEMVAAQANASSLD